MQHHNDEEIRPRQEVSGVGHIVAGGDVKFGGGKSPPPADHPHALRCRQCHDLTWRFTRECVHCGHDIGAWLAELDRQERQIAEKARLLRMAQRCAVISAGFAGVAWTNYFSGIAQLFVVGMAFVFGTGAFKAWEASTKK